MDIKTWLRSGQLVEVYGSEGALSNTWIEAEILDIQWENGTVHVNVAFNDESGESRKMQMQKNVSAESRFSDLANCIRPRPPCKMYDMSENNKNLMELLPSSNWCAGAALDARYTNCWRPGRIIEVSCTKEKMILFENGTTITMDSVPDLRPQVKWTPEGWLLVDSMLSHRSAELGTKYRYMPYVGEGVMSPNRKFVVDFVKSIFTEHPSFAKLIKKNWIGRHGKMPIPIIFMANYISGSQGFLTFEGSDAIVWKVEWFSFLQSGRRLVLASGWPEFASHYNAKDGDMFLAEALSEGHFKVKIISQNKSLVSNNTKRHKNAQKMKREIQAYNGDEVSGVHQESAAKIINDSHSGRKLFSGLRRRCRVPLQYQKECYQFFKNTTNRKKYPAVFCQTKKKNCSHYAVGGYQFCMLHILEDSLAPYKQCDFVIPTSGERCSFAVSQCITDSRFCWIHKQSKVKESILEDVHTSKKPEHGSMTLLLLSTIIAHHNFQPVEQPEPLVLVKDATDDNLVERKNKLEDQISKDVSDNKFNFKPCNSTDGRHDGLNTTGILSGNNTRFGSHYDLRGPTERERLIQPTRKDRDTEISNTINFKKNISNEEAAKTQIQISDFKIPPFQDIFQGLRDKIILPTLYSILYTGTLDPTRIGLMCTPYKLLDRCRECPTQKADNQNSDSFSNNGQEIRIVDWQGVMKQRPHKIGCSRKQKQILESNDLELQRKLRGKAFSKCLDIESQPYRIFSSAGSSTEGNGLGLTINQSELGKFYVNNNAYGSLSGEGKAEDTFNDIVATIHESIKRDNLNGTDNLSCRRNQCSVVPEDAVPSLDHDKVEIAMSENDVARFDHTNLGERCTRVYKKQKSAKDAYVSSHTVGNSNLETILQKLRKKDKFLHIRKRVESFIDENKSEPDWSNQTGSNASNVDLQDYIIGNDLQATKDDSKVSSSSKQICMATDSSQMCETNHCDGNANKEFHVNMHDSVSEDADAKNQKVIPSASLADSITDTQQKSRSEFKITPSESQLRSDISTVQLSIDPKNGEHEHSQTLVTKRKRNQRKNPAGRERVGFNLSAANGESCDYSKNVSEGLKPGYLLNKNINELDCANLHAAESSLFGIQEHQVKTELHIKKRKRKAGVEHSNVAECESNEVQRNPDNPSLCCRKKHTRSQFHEQLIESEYSRIYRTTSKRRAMQSRRYRGQDYLEKKSGKINMQEKTITEMDECAIEIEGSLSEKNGSDNDSLAIKKCVNNDPATKVEFISEELQDDASCKITAKDSNVLSLSEPNFIADFFY